MVCPCVLCPKGMLEGHGSPWASGSMRLSAAHLDPQETRWQDPRVIRLLQGVDCLSVRGGLLSHEPLSENWPHLLASPFCFRGACFRDAHCASPPASETPLLASITQSKSWVLALESRAYLEPGLPAQQGWCNFRAKERKKKKAAHFFLYCLVGRANPKGFMKFSCSDSRHGLSTTVYRVWVGYSYRSGHRG